MGSIQAKTDVEGGSSAGYFVASTAGSSVLDGAEPGLEVPREGVWRMIPPDDCENRSSEKLRMPRSGKESSNRIPGNHNQTR